MKSLVLLVALLFAVAISTTSPVASKAAPTGKQKAIMQFTEPVTLMGVVLKGEYLFVHDDEAMARGEACTFVYKGNAAIADKLVVSFHCTPTNRARANSFTVRMENIGGVNQLREFQFAGETEAHMVPAGQ